ncbi:MAG: hypothetical protein ACYCY8_11230 [Burkholderiales bacterium]
MQQQTTTNKQKKQDRTVFVLLVALFVTFICTIAIFQEDRLLDMQPQKLILTQQGCAYLSGLGLVPKRDASGCSIIVRYSAGFLGSERSILLDDDRFVTLSSGAILANADTNEKLPDTPGQKRALHITWGAIAVLFALMIGMVYGAVKD